MPRSDLPSVISHAAAALAIGSAFRRPGPPARFWLAGATCAVLPDLDVVGFRLGIHYGDFLGHRGFSHSLCFAGLLASMVLAGAFPRGLPGMSRLRLGLYLFLATASHGLLDALTNGGMGIALLAPFDNTRYFFPVRPIEVSPIRIGGFMSSRGAAVLMSEFWWVWLPSGALALGAYLWRRRHDGEGARFS